MRNNLGKKRRLSRKHKRIRAMMLGIVLIVFITAGLKEVFYKGENIDAMANVDSPNKELIEENKEAEEDKEIIVENEEKIKNIILSVVGDKVSDYGIYYYDLSNGKEVKINENKGFFGASTTKVALAMVVADKIQSGKIKSNQLVTYKDEFYEDGAGVLMKSIKAGESYELFKLVELMLVQSDNIATNMIFSVVWERDKFTEEITGIKLPDGKNMTTAKHQQLILKRLYENLDNNLLYDDILYYLKNTIINDRISKYIPQDIVAHKTGNYGAYMHDIGIVYLDKPYILCVYSTADEPGRENIAKISEGIYNLKIGQ